ncbi:hypothetical protein [Azohydromonas australica]|uniref:hypothetical protein n=1 Tax=Azohydromonas australica TaxID=364039 RepID=UPI00041434BB|nr:hypothetical protein [Azohydromonas australica]
MQGAALPGCRLEALFEPLRRAAHGHAKVERTSTGLGPFIVRQVAQARGGMVSMDLANCPHGIHRRAAHDAAPAAPH